MKFLWIWLGTTILAVSALGQSRVEVINCDWVDQARHRPVPAKIYYPVEGPGPFPVIIFSHGLGGTRENYAYLGQHWASHGYVSVHIQHLGSDDAVWRNSNHPYRDMQRATRDLSNAVNRPQDVSFAIDQMEKLSRQAGPLKGRLDLKHVGVAGHSFGAYTALASVGQSQARRFDLADARIGAAIAMSAPVPVRRGVDLDQVYRDIKVPVFHMTGTRDSSSLNDTTPAQRRSPFDHGVGHPRYLLILKDATHMAFSDSRRGAGQRDPKHHDYILKSSTAFWDAYLKEDASARKWLADGGFAAALGAAGTFEVSFR